MKWLKENWVPLLMLVCIAVMLIINRIDTHSYKHKIKTKSDSIAVLKYQYSALEKEAVLSSELVSAYKFALTTHQDSLQDLKTEIINQNKRHARQVADLIRIPSNVLYIDYRDWIDTVSFKRF